MTNITNSELLQEKKTPHIPHIIAIPKRMIKIFLCFLTKQTTKRSNKRDHSPNKPMNCVNPTKKDFPDKELDFLGNLNPPNHIKNILPKRGGIQQHLPSFLFHINIYNTHDLILHFQANILHVIGPNYLLLRSMTIASSNETTYKTP